MRTEAAPILDDFRQGGVDAFETLFRQHQRSVYGWILRLVRDAAAAEELTVDTFWRIYRAHARFDWALAVALIALVAFFPAAIPVLLYYL